MPGYVVEFESSFGPERRLFTLDDDRALHPQITQVLEELRQSGRVVEGGPDDVLAVYWNGEELDLLSSTGALGVSTTRPLVLRMQPKSVARVAVVASRDVNWSRIVLPPVEGAIGAMVAWFGAWRLADLREPFTTPDRVDIAVSVLLAAAIAAGLCIGVVQRREVSLRSVLPALLIAPFCGFAVALGAISIGTTPETGRFLVGRMLAWCLLVSLLSVVATTPIRTAGISRFVSAPVVGLVLGAFSGVLYSLPGPSMLLQALAFVTAGAGVGLAAIGLPLWRVEANLEVTEVGAA